MTHFLLFPFLQKSYRKRVILEFIYGNQLGRKLATLKTTFANIPGAQDDDKFGASKNLSPSVSKEYDIYCSKNNL